MDDNHNHRPIRSLAAYEDKYPEYLTGESNNDYLESNAMLRVDLARSS
jgi:hypothetical protein